jgi:hypothetical protein
MGTVPWARFDDPAEFTKLRELRRASLSSNAFPSQAVLLRDNGKDYDLYVRDELPAETERAWKELRATLPSR